MGFSDLAHTSMNNSPDDSSARGNSRTGDSPHTRGGSYTSNPYTHESPHAPGNSHTLGKLPRTIEIAKDGTWVRIIDQTKLPYELSYITITQWERMVEAIQRLEIRGAPALGVAGASALCLFATNQSNAVDISSFLDDLSRVSKSVATARPTAVNLSWGVRRAYKAALNARSLPTAEVKSLTQALIQETHAICEEDERSCRLIGANGASLFTEPSTVLTHCNAGSLATAYYGTALGVIYSAFEQGKITRVFADETRPVGQGARLSAWELAQVGVPTTVICDNMAASLMAQGKIDAVLVGADRICANGDTANKIGTYGLAVLAHYHHIPFYVAAPVSTIDWALAQGSLIEIEQRDPREVLARPIPGVDLYNPAFDVTPGNLVTAFITDKGIASPEKLDLLKYPE